MCSNFGKFQAFFAFHSFGGSISFLLRSLMAYPQVDNLLGNSLMESVSYAPPIDLMPTGPHVHEIEKAASATEEMLIEKQVPNEIEAKRRALFGGSDKPTPLKQPGTATDKHFSIRVSFSGFVFSLIDSSPSEICTIAVDNINAVAKWHQASKTLDSSFLMSIGWLQVDNHIPSAPFPVAVCPEGDEAYQGSDNVVNPTSETQPSTVPPLLFLGVEIAPKHSSGIVVSGLLLCSTVYRSASAQVLSPIHILCSLSA